MKGIAERHASDAPSAAWARGGAQKMPMPRVYVLSLQDGTGFVGLAGAR